MSMTAQIFPDWIVVYPGYDEDEEDEDYAIHRANNALERAASRCGNCSQGISKRKDDIVFVGDGILCRICDGCQMAKEVYGQEAFVRVREVGELIAFLRKEVKHDDC